MAVTVTHAFVSGIADNPQAVAAGEVLPSHWNANHVITGLRTALATDTIYNVSTTGNDITGDGSAGSPWATIQHAINVITMTLDLNGFNVTIQLADGTYAGASIGNFFNFVPNPANGLIFLPVPIVKIQGNASDHTKVTITPDLLNPITCFSVDCNNSSAIVCLKNITIRNPSAAGAVFTSGPTLVAIGDGDNIGTVEINNGGPAGGDSFVAQFGSIINLTDKIVCSGLNTYLMRADTESLVTDFFAGNLATTTITFSTASFGPGAACLFVQAGGTIWLTETTFVGTFTGQRFMCLNDGLIDVALIPGSSPTTLPGTVAGTVSGGGQYVYSNGVLGLHSSGGVTVSTLPSASQQGVGATNFVTDSSVGLSAGLGNIVSTSTSTAPSLNNVPVYSDGTNWRIG